MCIEVLDCCQDNCPAMIEGAVSGCVALPQTPANLFITSANLPGVCPFVCLFVGKHVKAPDRIIIRNLPENYLWTRKSPAVRFQKSSGSESGSKNFLKEFLLLWSRIQHICCRQILRNFSGVWRLTNNKPSDFGADPDDDPGPGIFNGILKISA